MDIQNRRALKTEASAALEACPNNRRLVTVYAGASVLVMLLVTLADFWLTHLVNQASGLGSLSTRSFLQTIQTVLPYGQLLLFLCWDLGFMNVMLRAVRHQSSGDRELLSGFSLFWPALRASLLQFFLFFGILMAAAYLGVFLFFLTPFSAPLSQALEPMLSGTLSTELLLSQEVLSAMLPAEIICLVLFALLAVPLYYRLRMVSYCLLDNPQAGALAALRESRAMMRGNRMKLFKLDLSFWWYYLLIFLAGLLAYADLLLAALGVALPLSTTAASLLFYVLYLAALFCIYRLFRCRVDSTYALAYESLRPRPQAGGVVLGNIFQM